MVYEFRLTIELGNAAMMNSQDVADALYIVARKLEQGSEDGVILDVNGNLVGEYWGDFHEFLTIEILKDGDEDADSEWANKDDA